MQTYYSFLENDRRHQDLEPHPSRRLIFGHKPPFAEIEMRNGSGSSNNLRTYNVHVKNLSDMSTMAGQGSSKVIESPNILARLFLDSLFRINSTSAEIGDPSVAVCQTRYPNIL